MSQPTPLDAQELRGLLALLDEPHDHEQDHSHDHHTRHHWSVTGITPRAAQLTRVTGTLDDPHFEEWLLPNTAIRLELPFQPPELHGIAGAPTTASRVYTVADADPASRTISVDFVVHEGDSPAMLWLRQVQIGDSVEVWEPSQHRLPHIASDHVLIADPTGLPAAISVIRGLDLPGRVRLLAQVPEDQVPDLPGVEVQRVDGTLIDAFLALDLSMVDSVWAAAESSEVRPIRQHCRRVLNLGKEATQVYGYWRRGTSNTQIDIDRLRLLRDVIAHGGDQSDLERRMEEEL